MAYFIEELVHHVAHALEMIGIFIILMSGVRALIVFIKSKFSLSNPHVSLNLAQGMNTALGFLLGAEITLSIVVKGLDNLIVLLGIAGLRVGLTFVLHWEIHQSEKICAEHDKMCKIK